MSTIDCALIIANVIKRKEQNIVLVGKRDVENRLCVDYREFDKTG